MNKQTLPKKRIETQKLLDVVALLESDMFAQRANYIDQELLNSDILRQDKRGAFARQILLRCLRVHREVIKEFKKSNALVANSKTSTTLPLLSELSSVSQKPSMWWYLSSNENVYVAMTDKGSLKFGYVLHTHDYADMEINETTRHHSGADSYYFVKSTQHDYQDFFVQPRGWATNDTQARLLTESPVNLGKMFSANVLQRYLWHCSNKIKEHSVE